MIAAPKPRLSPEEYLAIERGSSEKHEFWQGEMFALDGTSLVHNLIVANAIHALKTQLGERPCRVFASDLRVLVEASGLYTYPDVTVVCGETLHADDRRDTLVNPLLLVEVLSPSTEAYDRGKKFEHYRRIPALSEYLLVAQDEPRAESFSKREGDAWLFTSTAGLDTAIALSSLGIALSLAKIYDLVEFEPGSAALPPERELR